MKLLFGIVLLALSTAAGYRLSLKKKRRSLYFSDFRIFHREMMGAATFSKRSVLEVIGASKSRGDFNNTLAAYRDSLQNKKEFEPEFSDLTEEERETVRLYFDQIGKGDGAVQERLLGFYTQKIDELCAASERDRERYAALYIKLGFLLGLILMILVL